MVPTAILSMWISNTASTAMMIPILEVNTDLSVVILNKMVVHLRLRTDEMSS